MEKDPANRPASWSDVVDELKDIQHELNEASASEKGPEAGITGLSASMSRKKILICSIAAAVVLLAAVIAVGVSRQRPLQDTFDDPYLAYAEVEKTFRHISDKMNVGLELASEARTTAEKPAEILKKINQ